MAYPVITTGAVTNLHDIADAASGLQGLYRSRNVTPRTWERGNISDYELQEAPSEGEPEPVTLQAETKDSTQKRESKARSGQQTRLPDFGRRQGFTAFLRLIRQTVIRTRDTRRLKDIAEKCFPRDPALQYAALEAAAEVFGREGGGGSSNGFAHHDLIQELEALSAELMETKGSEIRAGLNISVGAVKTGFTTVDELSNFREFYCKAIFGFESPFDAYCYIMENYPG